jgi:hypothetical protein
VVTGKDAAPPKPCPDMLHEVGHRLERLADEKPFVGDLLLDFVAAGKAQVSFVACRGDFGGSQRVTSHAELFGLIHRLREKKIIFPVPSPFRGHIRRCIYDRLRCPSECE